MMPLTRAAAILGVTDIKDIEAVRREFAHRHTVLEDRSLKTQSARLKERYAAAQRLLEDAYKSACGIEEITDSRELLSFSKNPVTDQVNAMGMDPVYAQLVFGIVEPVSPELLTTLYEELKAELELEALKFDLESSRLPVNKELELLETCYQSSLLHLMKSSIREMVGEVDCEKPAKPGKGGKRVVLLLLALTVAAICYWLVA